MQGGLRVLGRAALALCAIVSVLVVVAGPSAACSCGMDVESWTTRWEAAFVGSVSGDLGKDRSIDLHVERWLKAPAEGVPAQVANASGCTGPMRAHRRMVVFLYRHEGTWHTGDRCHSLSTGLVLSRAEPAPAGSGEARFVTLAAPPDGYLAYLDGDGRLLEVTGEPSPHDYDFRGQLVRCEGGSRALAARPRSHGWEVTLWDLATRTQVDKAEVGTVTDLRCDEPTGKGRAVSELGVTELFGGVERSYLPWGQLTARGVVATTSVANEVNAVIRVTAVGPEGQEIAVLTEGPSVSFPWLATEPGNGSRVAIAPRGNADQPSVSVYDISNGKLLNQRIFDRPVEDLSWLSNGQIWVQLGKEAHLVDPDNLVTMSVTDGRYGAHGTVVDGALWVLSGGTVSALPLDGTPARSGYHANTELSAPVIALPPPPAPVQTTTPARAQTAAAAPTTTTSPAAPHSNSRSTAIAVGGGAVALVAVGSVLGLRRLRRR